MLFFLTKFLWLKTGMKNGSSSAKIIRFNFVSIFVKYFISISLPLTEIQKGQKRIRFNSITVNGYSLKPGYRKTPNSESSVWFFCLLSLFWVGSFAYLALSLSLSLEAKDMICKSLKKNDLGYQQIAKSTLKRKYTPGLASNLNQCVKVNYPGLFYI